MKTTKEIEDWLYEDMDTGKVKLYSERYNDKWFSVSDVEQLQKEIKERLFQCNPESKFLKMLERIIDDIFNNFKGK